MCQKSAVHCIMKRLYPINVNSTIRKATFFTQYQFARRQFIIPWYLPHFVNEMYMHIAVDKNT